MMNIYNLLMKIVLIVLVGVVLRVNTEFIVPITTKTYNVTVDGPISVRTFLHQFGSLGVCGDQIFKWSSHYCGKDKEGKPAVRSCQKLCGGHTPRRVMRCRKRCPEYHKCVNLMADPADIQWCLTLYVPREWVDAGKPTKSVRPQSEESVVDDESSTKPPTISVEVRETRMICSGTRVVAQYLIAMFLSVVAVFAPWIS